MKRQTIDESAVVIDQVHAPIVTSFDDVAQPVFAIDEPEALVVLYDLRRRDELPLLPVGKVC